MVSQIIGPACQHQATSQMKCDIRSFLGHLVGISIIHIVRTKAQWRHQVRNTTIGIPGRCRASSCSGNHRLCPPTIGPKPHVKLVHILLDFIAHIVWHKREQIENCTRRQPNILNWCTFYWTHPGCDTKDYILEHAHYNIPRNRSLLPTTTVC